MTMLRRVGLWAGVLAALAVLGACTPDSPAPGGADAGEEADTGPDRPDSGGVPDAGTEPDASVPVEDQDDDGIADEHDCDPEDADVGASGTSECTNACGTGTRTCADGVWSECDAPTDCLCDTPGATRIVPCPRCGRQGQTCADGEWMNSGSCLGAGECDGGAVEVEDPYPSDRCGRRERLCNEECGWDEWEMTRPAGECSPNPVPFCVPRDDDPVLSDFYICTAACMLEPTGEPCP